MASHLQSCAWPITLNTFILVRNDIDRLYVPFFKVLPQIPTMSYPVRISCCWYWHECVEGIFCCGISALLSFGFPVLVLPLIFYAHCWLDRSMVLTQSLQSGSYFVRVATIVVFFSTLFLPTKKSLSPNSVPLPGVISWTEVGILFGKFWSYFVLRVDLWYK